MMRDYVGRCIARLEALYTPERTTTGFPGGSGGPWNNRALDAFLDELDKRAVRDEPTVGRAFADAIESAKSKKGSQYPPVPADVLAKLEPKPTNLGAHVAAGCAWCKGRGHPSGWIEWDFVAADRVQHSAVSRCACNGGTNSPPSAPPGHVVVEHEMTISASARAATDALLARMASGDALRRVAAKGLLPPSLAGTNVRPDEKLRRGNWKSIAGP